MADIILDGIHLPGDLIWEDEFDWSVVERTSEPTYSLAGVPIFEESTKTAGRPITLVAKNESRGPIWLLRSTVLALHAKLNLPLHTMTLTLSDLRTFSVCFRGVGIDSEPVYHLMPHQDGDRYYLTISLITLA